MTALQGPRSDEERFPLLPTTRYVGWVALCLGALLAALGSGGWRLLGGGFAVALAVITLLVQARRPVLIVDDAGYRVEVAGRERFRVAWDEVRRVLRDRSESALYVDCGDGRRNLLVPPAGGYAFTFKNRARLVERIVARLPGQVQDVERLEQLGRPALPEGPGSGPAAKSG
jgi:predicted membrane metal-binding protein